jgi:anti-sigma B factor antagonist
VRAQSTTREGARVSFEVRTLPTDGFLVLEIHGELDLVTAADLEQAVETALAGSPALLAVDLTPTTFLDSSGARQVARAARSAARAGVPARVVCPKDNRTVRLVIDLLDMVSLVPVVESTGEITAASGP